MVQFNIVYSQIITATKLKTDGTTVKNIKVEDVENISREILIADMYD